MLKRAINLVFDNSLLLIAGAAGALVWANLCPGSYATMLRAPLLANPWIGLAAADGGRMIDLHFLVNDILMALFFALAGREVWEALLPGGQLHNPRRAALPLLCTLGGMAGPAALFLLGAAAVGSFAQLGRGWAIPTATDVAFSYMAAKLIFGAAHAAIPFLLLLAIADDALGLVVLAVFYPQEQVRPAFLLLSVLAVGLGLIMRRLRVRGFWWYLLGPGALSWLGFALGGLHGALGLLPIVPLVPNVQIQRRHTGWESMGLKGARQLEYWLKRPVEVILGLFGLLNAGVTLNQAGSATFIVLCALVAGKPAGIFLSGLLGIGLLRLHLPRGVSMREVLVIGFIAGIGFTVSLFIATAAFGQNNVQASAKMGALGSVLAAPLALGVARALGVRRAAVQQVQAGTPEVNNV